MSVMQPEGDCIIDIVDACSSRVSAREKLVSRKQVIDMVCVWLLRTHCPPLRLPRMPVYFHPKSKCTTPHLPIAAASPSPTLTPQLWLNFPPLRVSFAVFSSLCTSSLLSPVNDSSRLQEHKSLLPHYHTSARLHEHRLLPPTHSPARLLATFTLTQLLCADGFPRVAV